MALSSSAEKKSLLLNGTVRADRVAKRDLDFWLSYTKRHLRIGIPYVRSFEELVKLHHLVSFKIVIKKSKIS